MIQKTDIVVFDFDGTIINTNSFRQISKSLMLRLLKKGRLQAISCLTAYYVSRKCRVISHLTFKKKVVDLFENELSEEEKTKISEQIFCDYLNESVYHELLSCPDPIVSTASPYAFISRIPLPDHVRIISALNPDKCIPDKGNINTAKLANLSSYLNTKDIRLKTFYTDDPIEDEPLINVSERVFLVVKGRFEPFK